MFDGSKIKQIAKIQLPSHSIDGGYIYIPKKIIKKFSSKPFTAYFQFGNETLKLSVMIDSNYRLRINTSSQNIDSLHSLFIQFNIKPGYEVIINNRIEKRETQWLFIFYSRPKNIKKQEKELFQAPSFVNELSEVYSIVQNLGTRNSLKIISIMNEINTILTKTYKEVLDPTYLIKYSVNDCITEIQDDIRLHAFFNKYWESPSVRRLFSYRAEDVFPYSIEEDTTNIESQYEESPTHLFYIPIVSSLTKDDMNGVKAIHARILLELSHRYQSIVNLARDLLFVIGDKISEIEKIEEEFDQKELKKAISEILDTILKEFRKKEMRRDIKKLIKDLIQDWGWLFPRLFWFIIEKQIKITNAWMSELSLRSNLDNEIIYKAFDSLIDDQVLRPILLISWCNNHPDQPQFHISTGIISRSKTLCGKCHDEMKCLLLTSIHPSILKFLKHHDGLPLIAAAWLAQKKGLHWETNYSQKDIEIDLWITDRKNEKAAIFEFWITNVAEDKKAFTRRLNDKKHQLEVNCKKLNNSIKGITIANKYIVINIPKLKLSELLKFQKGKNNIHAISIDEMETIFNEFN